ncbi:hypothetical protein FE257_000938 [Aspergillus nanangensis]|uniref:CENP-V/GFA domain-containing protein n=1 Tax=Aspergillus nanangensis TaxID=2582783 RepID=A0AAD4CE84_ASPNN|nr:hypothetical protein FE257_000938 [Aspergillus nanangensis]
MASHPETTTLTASCLCRNVQFTLDVATDILPLKAHLCHCNVCRQTHGAPCSFHAPLPEGISPNFIAPSSLDKLTPYTHATSLSTRFFCSTCGCHIGDRDLDKNKWYISISIFTTNQPRPPNQAIWKINSYAHTHSTKDGGLSSLIPRINGHEVPIWNPDPVPDDVPNTNPSAPDLLAQCHCGGVSFTVSRPRPEFIASPASQGWLHPSDKTKWLTLLDACNSCRLVTGTHIIAWMFIPRDHATPNIPTDLLIGTSKTYESSEGVLRSFCGTCGTTVFYSCADRPDVVDIAMGILRAPEGFLAEEWAFWRTARVGSPEDGRGYDSAFTGGLEEGLREWGVRRDGMVRDFTVGS